MVYCTKCGTKNPDDVQTCSQCGASLYMERRKERGRYEDECFGTRRRREPRAREEYECFGIPRGGVIVGIAIGLIIILAGFIWLLQQADIVPSTLEVWPFAFMVFGLLIIIGALYGLRRRY
jgi:uncharacterized membrane protein YvbJ